MKLTKAQRDALPDSAFAGPKRTFPINDRAHAEAALLNVNRAKGLTRGERAEIKAEARRELKRTHPAHKR